MLHTQILRLDCPYRQSRVRVRFSSPLGSYTCNKTFHCCPRTSRNSSLTHYHLLGTNSLDSSHATPQRKTLLSITILENAMKNIDAARNAIVRKATRTSRTMQRTVIRLSIDLAKKGKLKIKTKTKTRSACIARTADATTITSKTVTIS
jgi:hypothetical protein